jgi:predicted transcriptional regulator
VREPAKAGHNRVHEGNTLVVRLGLTHGFHEHVNVCIELCQQKMSEQPEP